MPNTELSGYAFVASRVSSVRAWQMTTCVGDAQANAMLKRKYRAPFVVPDNV